MFLFFVILPQTEVYFFPKYSSLASFLIKFIDQIFISLFFTYSCIAHTLIFQLELFII
jgi:hypothetical protein